MLFTASDYIYRFNDSAEVLFFVQELTTEAYAICLAEILIKGQDIKNIMYDNTMQEDFFKDTKMRFVIKNPSFVWDGVSIMLLSRERAVEDSIIKSIIADFLQDYQEMICKCCFYNQQ